MKPDVKDFLDRGLGSGWEEQRMWHALAECIQSTRSNLSTAKDFQKALKLVSKLALALETAFVVFEDDNEKIDRIARFCRNSTRLLVMHEAVRAPWHLKMSLSEMNEEEQQQTLNLLRPLVPLQPKWATSPSSAGRATGDQARAATAKDKTLDIRDAILRKNSSTWPSYGRRQEAAMFGAARRVTPEDVLEDGGRMPSDQEIGKNRI